MSKVKVLKVGTRGSALALTQTRQVIQNLQALHPGLEVEIQKITTSGDKIQDRFLATEGGKGLFVKEIEEALANQEVDFAVHSLKDFPGDIHEGLEIFCYPKRKPPWDILLSKDNLPLEKLKPHAKVGTSSLRRRAQISNLRSDLDFAMLRGNIDTRVKKMKAGDFDAIVLAQAGLERLGLESGVRLPIIPAPGQGILAIEGRRGDEVIQSLFHGIHDPDAALMARVERKISKALGGDCTLPLGCLAQFENDILKVRVFLGLPDGSQIIKLEKQGPKLDPEALIEEVLQELNAQGAAEVVRACRSH